jgi:hypothetical protein
MQPVTRNKKIAILQSNYIPWKGYFDIINTVNEFVIYDEVQYTKNDWRNRNLIKKPGGLMWLTIPCRRERLNQSIKDTRIYSKYWYRKHLNALYSNYASAPAFKEMIQKIREWYISASDKKYISDINIHFIRAVVEYLEIKTIITSSTDYGACGDRIGKLVDICKKAGATEYISGSSARNYLNENEFTNSGIKLSYFDYSGYPTYEQIHSPYTDRVSIIDLILHKGSDTPEFMKTFKR